MSSQELNEMMEKSKDQIEEIRNNVQFIKNDTSKKVKIISYTFSYFNELLLRTDETSLYNQNNVLLRDCIRGVFDRYGSTVHPKFIRTPNNIFNISTTKGVMFRSDAKAILRYYQDSAESHPVEENWTDILKHDSIMDKEIMFAEMPKDTFEIEISVNTKNILGSTKINAIELDPLFPGSFDIEEIEIHQLSDNKNETNSITLPKVSRVSQSRIIINGGDHVQFHKIIFKFKSYYKANQSGTIVYPFGFKHIYLYDAALEKDSYVVAEIKSNKYIDSINDTINVKNVYNNIIEDSLTERGAELYADIIENEFETELYPSTAVREITFARSLKTIYAKIPIKESLISIKFGINTKTDI